MRAFVLVLTGSLLLATAAAAENYVLRDGDGALTGTFRQVPGAVLAIDPVGPTGYGFSDERIGGRQPVRDGLGREIGTVEPWLSGQLILRDAAGRRVDTLHSIGNGRYLVGDRLDSGIPTLDLR